jgi:hypothetical protein
MPGLPSAARLNRWSAGFFGQKISKGGQRYGRVAARNPFTYFSPAVARLRENPPPTPPNRVRAPESARTPDRRTRCLVKLIWRFGRFRTKLKRDPAVEHYIDLEAFSILP